MLRRLNYLNQIYDKQQWSVAFQQLLYDAMALKNRMTSDDYILNNERSNILKRADDLLQKPPDKKHKQLFSFYNRMVKEKEFLFTFLFVPEVPYDNNSSERSIRSGKVKMKISGMFKTTKGAEDFAILRSVVDTIIKNNKNVLDGLLAIVNLS